MNRRELIQSAVASLPLISVAHAQQIAKNTNGLPPLTIKDVKVITTNGGTTIAGSSSRSSPVSPVFMVLARPTITLRPWPWSQLSKTI